MTSDQIRTTFKAFGKFIQLSQMVGGYSQALRMHEVATSDQITSADPATYPIFKTVMIPLELSVGRIISNIDSIPLRAQQALEAYLTLLADDLDVSAGSTVAAKL